LDRRKFVSKRYLSVCLFGIEWIEDTLGIEEKHFNRKNIQDNSREGMGEQRHILVQLLAYAKGQASFLAMHPWIHEILIETVL
jgi:hypothetical protein